MLTVVAAWRVTQRIQCAMLIVALASCNPFQCSYEYRFIGLDGAATSPDGNLTVTYVNFSQYRNGQPVPSSVTWRLSAQNLQSSPKRVTLRSASNEVILELFASSGSSSSLTSESSMNIDEASASPLFDTLSQPVSTVVELQNGHLIVAALRATQTIGWHHPDC